MPDPCFLTVISIVRSFEWGAICRLQAGSDHFREERKLGWDRLRAPKLLRRVIDVKAGDTLEATVLLPDLRVGQRLPLSYVQAEIGLWSEWQ